MQIWLTIIKFRFFRFDSHNNQIPIFQIWLFKIKFESNLTFLLLSPMLRMWTPVVAFRKCHLSNPALYIAHIYAIVKTPPFPRNFTITRKMEHKYAHVSAKAEYDLESGEILHPSLSAGENQLRWGFVRKVYGILSAQIVITTVVSSIFVFYSPINDLLRGNSGLLLFLIFLPFICTGYSGLLFLIFWMHITHLIVSYRSDLLLHRILRNFIWILYRFWRIVFGFMQLMCP